MFLPVIGAEVAGATSLYYRGFVPFGAQCDVTSLLTIPLLQTAMVHSAYGWDRFCDVRAGGSNDAELKDYIAHHGNEVAVTTALSGLGSVMYLLSQEQYVPAVIFTVLTLGYRDIKEYLPTLKPFLIAIALGYMSTILPDVIHGGDTGSLYENFLSTSFAIAAGSINADIDDKWEDAENGINTIPVQYGQRYAYGVSSLLYLTSALVMHPSNWLGQGLRLLSLGQAGLSFIKSRIMPWV